MSNKAFKYVHLDDEILKLYDDSPVVRQLVNKLLDKYPDHGYTEPGLRRYATNLIKSQYDEEIIEENVRLAKQKQKAQDKNRIANKSFREHARIENAVEEYNKEIVELLEADALKIETIEHPSLIVSVNRHMVIQVSDWHLNELVDIESNKFDFYVAAKRAKKLANLAIKFGKQWEIKNITLAFCGDLLNSDRRLDELLSASTNRAKATLLSVKLFKQFILHLNKYFNVNACGVTGNESRAKQELGWSDVLATDSYDFTIYEVLAELFKDKEGVVFHTMQANEQVVEINNLNVLIIHGHQLSKDVQRSVQQIIGKYAMSGIIINYVLCGHIHSTNISDYFSRNASLVGDNAYSEQGLLYRSKASQNIHLLIDGDIHSIKTDLQETNGIPGYPMEKNINAYNAKSVKKIKETTQQTIFKVVI